MNTPERIAEKEAAREAYCTSIEAICHKLDDNYEPRREVTFSQALPNPQQAKLSWESNQI